MRLSRLLQISRPRFWLYLLGPALLGLGGGLDFSQMSIPLLVGIVLSLVYWCLPANLLLYGVNDLADAEIDRLNRKKYTKEHLLADQEQAMLKKIMVGLLIISLALGWYLEGLAGIWLYLFLGLALLYSLPPVWFKRRPGWDSYSNALYIMPGLSIYGLLTAAWPPLPIVLAGVAWSAAMHALSAIPDIQPDSRAGIATIATRLGQRGTLIFCGANWLVAAGLILSQSPIGSLLLVYPLVCAWLWLNPQQIKRWYWYFPWINGVLGAIGFWFLVFGFSSPTLAVNI